MNLTALGIFSGLACNLLLQCGLGMGDIAAGKEHQSRFPLLQTGVLFATIVLIRLIFPVFLFLFGSGYFAYIIIFPASALVCCGLESICVKIFRKKDLLRLFNSYTGYDGLAAASIFAAVNIASNFAETVFLAAGFSLGVLAAVLILMEIRRRSAMEAVPHFLRGSPLVLVSMGLLSLIFSAAALFFFNALGNIRQ
jgi:electron transport complex protein RnfA